MTCTPIRGAPPTGQHYQILQDIGMRSNVYQDIANMGLANKVCLMVTANSAGASSQNASGTDHGSQAPVFCHRGAVHGGCLRQPSRHHGPHDL